ncbi:hypothetical protein GIB67_008645 [Kingdonia uniflora]|uniref:Palmitoyl-protein thioesterase 1 n=1 Tax=Kingdonia uniflora TaxID=39325 RepID=A0A7J7M576_9MAGN|nr:hypothetical protein GIB67_008645 [Kingdonia uniflora]
MASLQLPMRMMMLIMMVISLVLVSIPTSAALPFVLLHGIGGYCGEMFYSWFKTYAGSMSGSTGYCIEIGNGAPDSWTMPLHEQARIACEKVKQMTELKDGYNIVGISQGNLIARGLIELCDGGPRVNNYISLGGPQAGIISFCMPLFHMQEHMAPSGYIKVPNDIPGYLKGCKYLPRINNEIPDQRNATYKERFSSLKNLVLIMFEEDTIVVPKETAWFGFYPDGDLTKILPPQETKLYTEDWIGLRTLDEAKRVHFIHLPGIHIGITPAGIIENVVPYLKEQVSAKNNN